MSQFDVPTGIREQSIHPRIHQPPPQLLRRALRLLHLRPTEDATKKTRSSVTGPGDTIATVRPGPEAPPSRSRAPGRPSSSDVA
ncbi:hypothetical protein QP028_14970 [Corynebacterium suedekumii]|nr:hypothetical protein QP028_14970 [Corynebacterium suedekumii]